MARVPVVPSAARPGTSAASAIRSTGSDTSSTLRWRPGIHHWSWSSIQLESLHRGTTMHSSLAPSTSASVSSKVEARRLSLPSPTNRPFTQTQAIESAEPMRRNVRRPVHDASTRTSAGTGRSGCRRVRRERGVATASGCSGRSARRAASSCCPGANTHDDGTGIDAHRDVGSTTIAGVTSSGVSTRRKCQSPSSDITHGDGPSDRASARSSREGSADVIGVRPRLWTSGVNQPLSGNGSAGTSGGVAGRFMLIRRRPFTRTPR